jgi:hypothetical protein
MAGFGGIISGIGGLIAGGIEAGGLNQAAGMLDKAASLERTNEKVAQASGDLQTYGLYRAVNKQRGASFASAGAAGFLKTGSVKDVDRGSIAQYYQGHEVIKNQTAIDVNSYEVQAQSFEAQAAIDRAQAQADQVSGIFGMLSGIIGMMG